MINPSLRKSPSSTRGRRVWPYRVIAAVVGLNAIIAVTDGHAREAAASGLFAVGCALLGSRLPERNARLSWIAWTMVAAGVVFELVRVRPW